MACSRFAWVLAGWVVALVAASLALTHVLASWRGGAVALLAGLIVVAALTGLLRYVSRTNLMLARFVEALRHGDFATRFVGRDGAGFPELGEALSGAMRRLQDERGRDQEELRFREALIDDLPVALLTVGAAGDVSLINKAARQTFDRHDGADLPGLAVYGDEFLLCLSDAVPKTQTIVPVQLAGGSQRAVVRAGLVSRLGAAVRVVAVEPVQRALDAVELGTQTDLIRVLSHELLNSLTPVTSLAGTTAVLLGEEEPDLAEARLAVLTLARRAEGMRRFIDSYRMVARLPEPRPRSFAAAPFATELDRLFRVEWLEHRLEIVIDAGLTLTADPDLLAQLLINLLRNAAQATADRPRPAVRLAMRDEPGDGQVISVEDNGPGVPPEARREVFLPFFTTRSQGTGIGLNVARQIAVAHGWRIEIADGDLGGAAIRVFTSPEL